MPSEPMNPRPAEPGLAPRGPWEVRPRMLPNGLKMLFLDEPGCGLVSVQLWIKTGSMDEGEWLGSGLSHYLEHMVFKGTARRSGMDIAREVQEIGGHINAYTGFDRTVYHIDGPAHGFRPSCEILADMVFCPLLDAVESERERDVILREIDMGLDDPDRQLSRSIFAEIFHRHPIRFPVIGHRDLFQTLRHDDLRCYHQRRYAPDNAVLVVVGDLERAQAEDVVSSTFGSVARRSVAPVLYPEEPPQLASRVVRMTDTVQISRGVVALRVATRLGDPSNAALRLLGSILGRGRSSRLWRSLREERKVVNSISVTNLTYGSMGLVWASYVCPQGNETAAEEGILDAMGDLADGGIEPAELEKARRREMVADLDARKSVSAMAGKIGWAEAVAGDLTFLRSEWDRIQSCSREEVEAVWRDRLRLEQITLGTLRGETGSGPSAVDLPRRGRDHAGFACHSLSNGLEVHLQVDRRLPKVHLRVVGQGGVWLDPPGQSGLTALMSTLLTRDAGARSGAEIDTLVDAHGGQFHEHSGSNTFGLAVEFLSSDLRLAVEILGDALCQPIFARDAFESEREAQVAAIQQDADEILECGRKHLRKLVFGRHPFARDAAGEIEDLRGLTVAEVREHYRRLVTARNLHLVVVGDFEGGEVVELLEAGLAALAVGDPLPDLSPVPGMARQGPQFLAMPKEQAVLLQGFRDCPVSAPEMPAGDVLQEALNDMSGPLFTRVREQRGLAYYVGLSRVSGLNTGLLSFYAGTHPEAVEEVRQEFLLERRRLRESGLTEAEFRRSRERLKSNLLFQREAIGTRAYVAALHRALGFPIDHAERYISRLDALKGTDVLQYARQYLQEEDMVDLVVGPDRVPDADGE